MPVRKKGRLTIAQAAARFCMEIASVTSWVKNPNLKQTRKKPAAKIDMIALARDVQACPGAYQAERARRPRVSEKGIGHTLRRMNISYKKNLQHPKVGESKRHTFQETIKLYEAQNRAIVYINEGGFAHDIPRTHGYAPNDKRCHGVCNWHARGRVNMIKALIGKYLLTVGLFKSNNNADTFLGWRYTICCQNSHQHQLRSWIMRPSAKGRYSKCNHIGRIYA
ncbi:IS630 transposase-related protein [Nitrosomonas communis]|uniref:IS630 transposase-related protein n=1 Tax=Nitrosomonas communis TaxID=44574 RepID=UPI001BA72CB7|nr:IS630 transposase-related protein [Nitrosomonas communis]